MSYILSIIIGLFLSAKISKQPESRRVGYHKGQDVRAICYPSGRLFLACSEFPTNYEVRQEDVEAFFKAFDIAPVKEPKPASVLWVPPTQAIEPVRVEKPKVKKTAKK